MIDRGIQESAPELHFLHQKDPCGKPCRVLWKTRSRKGQKYSGRAVLRGFGYNRQLYGVSGLE